MVLAWVSLPRIVSRRSFTAILLVFVLAISFHALVHPHFHSSLRFHPHVDSDWTRTYDREHIQSQEKPPLGKHTFTSDGRLLVNPDGPHPIFQLIRDAEAAWEVKRERASKTLDEAVAEYRRRYRRAPPLGFDKWWDYVVKHRVQLPDEYDEIFEDIQPFWGIDPYELGRTQQELETRKNVVTVQKTDPHSRFQVVHSTLTPDRQGLQDGVNDILALIREVEQNLPPLRITISPFDNPGMLSDWQVKNMALEAAANGTTLTPTDIPPVSERGWVQACPPDSPARLHPPTLPPPLSTPPVPTSSIKTFIASHRDAMNPCMNPSLLTSHGQFLSHKSGPLPQRTLVPCFSFCATLLHHDIRPPVPYGWVFDSDSNTDADDAGVDGDDAFEGDVSWEHKTNERLDWRGRTTGIYASQDTWWVKGHRARLVTLANSLEGNVSVLYVTENKIENEEEADSEASPVGIPESVPLAQLNPAWMDVAFADGPIACDEDGGTCDEMARKWSFQELQTRREEGRYKFILDVDGHGWSGRFKRLMTSNALIFKATIYPEWYTSRVAPWVHYVPVQVSYDDLYDVVSFFRVHDALAGRIARAGRAWSQRFWRREDMTAYLYRRVCAESDREVGADTRIGCCWSTRVW